jgi:hypothetical protein
MVIADLSPENDGLVRVIVMPHNALVPHAHLMLLARRSSALARLPVRGSIDFAFEQAKDAAGNRALRDALESGPSVVSVATLGPEGSYAPLAGRWAFTGTSVRPG